MIFQRLFVEPYKIFSARQQPKGQSISKGNFSVFNSSKNRRPKKLNLIFSNFCPSLLGQKIFVQILEELKKPKSPFEIK